MYGGAYPCDCCCGLTVGPAGVVGAGCTRGTLLAEIKLANEAGVRGAELSMNMYLSAPFLSYSLVTVVTGPDEVAVVAAVEEGTKAPWRSVSLARPKREEGAEERDGLLLITLLSSLD